MNRLLVLAALGAAGMMMGYATHPSGHARSSSYAASAYAAPSTAAGGTAHFVDNAAILQAIDNARVSVLVSAYTLSPRAAILQHLRAAQSRGIRTQLVLTGDGMGYAIDNNRDIKASERGMHILLLDRPIHLKCVVVDHGARVFVTDRNFAKDADLVLQLPSRYALPLERAAIGDPHDAPPLTVTKGASLDAEAALIDRAQRTISIETESFGSGNPVTDAIEQALQRGVHVHLVVAQQEATEASHRAERALLNQFSRAGVIVDTSTADQKIAIIDGDTGWIGSSNATRMLRDQIDWGYVTDDIRMLQTMQHAINEDAGRATP